jgi:NAD(P)-dependent dehydrogenase (short-subunit alcohol dehydrogenase family)
MSGRLGWAVVVITGAARGIGRACAVACADEGADLVLLDVAADVAGVPYPLGTRSQLDCTADLCRQRGAAVLPLVADVRDPVAVREAVEQALDRFGRLDVLVNNAGIVAPSGCATHEITESDWALMFDVNVTGALRMLRCVVGGEDGMARRRSGSVVNVASTAGLVGYRHFAGYVASKHALIGLTRAAALDYAPVQVRVNAVCPGSVRDDPWYEGRMLAAIGASLGIDDDDHERVLLAEQPGRALVEAADVAGAVVWLASGESRHVTGGVVTVDGGFTVR